MLALVVAAAIAEDDPLSGDGFSDELVEGVGVGAVIVEPAFEQLAEFVGVFVGEEECFGAAAVLERVLAGAFCTFFGTRTGGVAELFGWQCRFGIEIGHEASFACRLFGRRSGNELSDWCGGRRRKFEICDGPFWLGSVGLIPGFLRNELPVGFVFEKLFVGSERVSPLWGGGSFMATNLSSHAITNVDVTK